MQRTPSGLRSNYNNIELTDLTTNRTLQATSPRIGTAVLSDRSGVRISPGPLTAIHGLRGTRASCTSRANKKNGALVAPFFVAVPDNIRTPDFAPSATRSRLLQLRSSAIQFVVTPFTSNTLPIVAKAQDLQEFRKLLVLTKKLEFVQVYDVNFVHYA